MGIELNKIKTWQFCTENARRKNATKNMKLNCWGSIHYKEQLPWIIMIRGDFYQRVIEHHKAEMENLYPGEEFHLIQDNHPAHRGMGIGCSSNLCN